MIQFFGQLIKLPLEALVYSMEMLVKTMRGIQQIACHGIDMVADGIVHPLGDMAGPESDAITDAITDVTDDASGESADIAQQMPQKEERKMADRDLRDDMLKLVRYKILFVKRDYEGVLLPDVEELVHDNITEADYIGWKIAEFIQKLRDQTTKIPKHWKGYPENKPEYRQGDTLLGLPEEDKKYLRVYYEVLDRYARERFKYEEEQIDVLKEIRDSLRDKAKIEGEIRDRLG